MSMMTMLPCTQLHAAFLIEVDRGAMTQAAVGWPRKGSSCATQCRPLLLSRQLPLGSLFWFMFLSAIVPTFTELSQSGTFSHSRFIHIALVCACKLVAVICCMQHMGIKVERRTSPQLHEVAQAISMQEQWPAPQHEQTRRLREADSSANKVLPKAPLTSHATGANLLLHGRQHMERQGRWRCNKEHTGS